MRDTWISHPCRGMCEEHCVVRERGRRTYAEERPGAADRVQVHLTHGLVVEQGHPEERHTHRRAQLE